jgi:Fibronectin type III domain
MPFHFESRAILAVGALGVALRITRLAGVLAGILFFAMLHNPGEAFGDTLPAGQSVTLAWDPSLDTNVVGYNVYYWAASQTYTNMINAGNATSATISGLIPGMTYCFVATAYDNSGEESVFSGEISYLVPGGPPTVKLRGVFGGLFALTVTGTSGDTYDIEATQDFTTWTVIGIVTLDASGSVDFTDMNAANFPQRFYRTEEVQ